MPQTNKRSAAKSQSRTRSRGSSGKSRVSDTGQTVSRAASKAKVPLVAGGAALAGAAGGLALGMRRGRGGFRRPRLTVGPQVKVSSRDLAKAAKEVGNLASELQRAREANGAATRRSPVEVVLEGLTARRSRH